MMVRGKKEKWYTSARVYIVLKAAIPLVLLSAGMSRCSAWISTKLCTILYIRTDLAFARLCSSDSHFKLEIIDVTTPGSRSWKLFETNRASLRCTESSWDIWFLLNGSHTELAYSMETRCILLFKYCSWYLSLLKVVSVKFMRILFTRDYPARETTFFRSQKL